METLVEAKRDILKESTTNCNFLKNTKTYFLIIVSIIFTYPYQSNTKKNSLKKHLPKYFHQLPFIFVA